MISVGRITRFPNNRLEAVGLQQARNARRQQQNANLPARCGFVRTHRKFAVVSAVASIAGPAEDQQPPTRAGATTSRRPGAPLGRRERQEELLTRLRALDLVEGTVTDIQPFGAFVDIGGLQALLCIPDVSQEHINSMEQVVTVGDRIRALVAQVRTNSRRVALNTKLLESAPGEMLRDARAVYDKAEEAVEAWRCRTQEVTGKLLDGVVESVHDYGVYVNLEGDAQGVWGRRGFLPASLVSQARPDREALTGVFQKGDRIRALGLALGRTELTLVLSTRVLEATPGEMLRDAQAVYAKAEEVLQGEQGRIRVEEALRPSKLPRPVLLPQRKEAERLGKRLGRSKDFQGFKVGDVVAGVVQSVKPYGAFVDLGGVTGLLHVSQLSHDRVLMMDKLLQEGDKVKVMILNHDHERGRVTLSTKKLEPTRGDMLRDPQLVYDKAEEMAARFRDAIKLASGSG